MPRTRKPTPSILQFVPPGRSNLKATAADLLETTIWGFQLDHFLVTDRLMTAAEVAALREEAAPLYARLRPRGHTK
jgi:hypothetical protein